MPENYSSLRGLQKDILVARRWFMSLLLLDILLVWLLFGGMNS
jgi:hypothetical protein